MTENDKQLFSGQYFLKWNGNQWKTLMKTPSYVQAILIVDAAAGDHHHQHGAKKPPSILIVCALGEVFALDHHDWQKTAWQRKIELPLGATGFVEQISYAVYDAVSDCIFVKVLNVGKISAINRKALLDKVHSYGVMVVPSDDRHFCGLAVDAQRRLMFACDYDHKEIAIFKLIDKQQNNNYATPTAVQVAKIKCQIGDDGVSMTPYYLALFVVKKDRQGAVIHESLRKTLPTKNHGGDILLMAIGDYQNDRVDLVAADVAAFEAFTVDKTIESDDEKIQQREISDIFGYVGPVACKNSKDSMKLGSISKPRDLVFDPNGNLFIADNWNNRVQACSFGSSDSSSSDSPMAAVWLTAQNATLVDRVVLAVNPATSLPIILSSHSNPNRIDIYSP